MAIIKRKNTPSKTPATIIIFLSVVDISSDFTVVVGTAAELLPVAATGVEVVLAIGVLALAVVVVLEGIELEAVVLVGDVLVVGLAGTVVVVVEGTVEVLVGIVVVDVVVVA